MPQISFTSHLRRHLPCDIVEVEGATVSEAFEQVFLMHKELRGYLLDDQGAVRKHVMIFVDNQPLGDRTSLSDSLSEDSRVYVMQALSGG